MLRRLTKQEAKDLLTGCAILGTGGGGSLEVGLKLVEEDYANGLQYELLPLNEVNDSDLFTSPYYCGSIGKSEDEEYSKYPVAKELPTIMAVKALERHMGKKFSGIVSVEYGGGNTAVALSTAARMGLPVVDADAAGRAVPDLQFSTFYIAERSITPLGIATTIGETAVLESAYDDFRAEALVRIMAVVSGNLVGMSDHPISGLDLRSSVIDGALSYALEVGKVRREAFEAGEDPIAAICKAADGYILFEGLAARDTDWKNEAGFTLGTIDVEGTGDFKGGEFSIWFKNENVVSHKDGKPFVTCPDLICVLEKDTGMPVLNPDCKKGDNVAVLGFPAPEVWTKGRGIEILNPSFFGFDIKWTPIKEIMGGTE